MFCMHPAPTPSTSRWTATALRPPAAALLGPVALLALLVSAPPGARADVEDLSPRARSVDQTPPTLALKVEGGSNFAPTGNVGGVLSYYNDWSGSEVDAGAGAGFPGVQLGLALRKLLGERGDFFASEISLAYNSKVTRGVDLLSPGSGTHLWLNLGIGFEHRGGWLLYGVTGGLTLTGFSQTPQGFVHGGIGVAIF